MSSRHRNHRHAGIGSKTRFPGPASTARHTREPLINSHRSAGSRRVAGAVAMSSIFLLRVLRHERRRARTRAYARTCVRDAPHARRSRSDGGWGRGGGEESSFTSDFTDCDSRRSRGASRSRPSCRVTSASASFIYPSKRRCVIGHPRFPSVDNHRRRETET